MVNTKYKLRYLPLFYEDLEEKAVYIAEKLGNVKAANDLLDEVEKTNNFQKQMEHNSMKSYLLRLRNNDTIFNEVRYPTRFSELDKALAGGLVIGNKQTGYQYPLPCKGVF